MSNPYLWRYATKKFDPTKKISKEQFEGLLEVLRLAPSSYGLQPWKFVVVEDPQLRQALRKQAWDQAQITDASHLVVLCAKTEMDEAYVKRFVKIMAEVQQIDIQTLAGYEQMMVGSLQRLSKEGALEWMKRQVYIALGTLLTECAYREIDACPMEGFDSKQFDEILKLSSRGLTATVVCALGYRAKDDTYAALKKVRFCKDELVLRV